MRSPMAFPLTPRNTDRIVRKEKRGLTWYRYFGERGVRFLRKFFVDTPSRQKKNFAQRYIAFNEEKISIITIRIGFVLVRIFLGGQLK